MSNQDQDTFYEALDEPSNKWWFAAVTGLFISLFMTAFQPFGVTNHDPDFRISLFFVALMLAVGVIVMLVLAFNEFVLRPRLIPAFSFPTLLAWMAWIYLLVGTVVFLLYNAVGNWHDFRLVSWLGFIRDVGMVMTFPVAGYLFYVRHQALRSEYVALQSSPPESSDRMVTFTSENGKDPLIVSLRDVLYLESEDNYVGINYLEDGQPGSHLIRSSLKRLEHLTAGTQLVRCHRSYIVNLSRVRSCRGNRQGLHLKLTGMSGIVPVSRKYADAVLESLQAKPVTGAT